MTRPRMAWLVLPALGALGLLTYGWLRPGAAATPIPDRQHALENLQRLEKELRDAEQTFKEQRVKGRTEVLEKEERLRSTEARISAPRTKDLAELQRLEDSLKSHAQFVASPKINEAMAKIQIEIDVLHKKEKEYAELLVKARKELVIAEENLRLIEQQQAHQLRRLYVKLGAAEARLEPPKEDSPRPDPSKRRIDELEAKIDLLLREMADLKRGLRRP